MLLDRAETDWLASKNIFYNIRTNEISDNINELIDPNHIELHSEGLYNYVNYGYSVFGQTPIYEIKRLEHDSIIYHDTSGKLVIKQKEDTMEPLLGIHVSQKDVVDCLADAINSWEEKQGGHIIVPTSGGFDSRLLNLMIKNKKRVHAYTFGISAKQNQSLEVLYAKKLCEILSISWNQIEIGQFHEMMDEWYEFFGISTHSHGMYQMEFYKKIAKYEPKNTPVVSGIYGDLWAGNWDFKDMETVEELVLLGITHGMSADVSQLLFSSNHDIRDSYWKENKEKLQDRNHRIIEAARIKMVLISYLLRVPEYYGFSAWSPFIDKTIVSMMLNMDWQEKVHRKWQVELFRRNNVLIGEMGIQCDRTNCLNLSAYKAVPLKDLNVKLLQGIFRKEYLETINRRIRNVGHKEWSKFYCAYLTLYPIERILSLKYGMKKEN